MCPGLDLYHFPSDTLSSADADMYTLPGIMGKSATG
jgi:hypothetical protein